MKRDLDLMMTALLSLAMLGALSAFVGVWEPWEAQQAAFAATLREGGHALVAELPKLNSADAPRYALPWASWPTRVSLWLLGDTELGLRLPSILATTGALVVLMAVVRALWGRLAGWLAVLAALGAPIVLFHGRQNLGGGLEMALVGASTLAWLRTLCADTPAGGWRWAAPLLTAAAGLCGGLVAFAVPVAAAATALALADAETRGQALRLVRVPWAFACAVLLTGWGAAVAALPDASGALSLLLLTEPYDGLTASASWPTFDRITHQLGYGLFPIAGLVPFALGRALWSVRDDAGESDHANADAGSDGHTAQQRHAEIALAAAFAVAFLGVALPVPLSDGARFSGALVVAASIGVYLAGLVRRPPEPMLALGTALVLMLLDHGLKHDPKALVEALTMARVETFPSTLQFWPARRILAAVLIAVVVLYQGGAWRLVPPVARFVAFPRSALRPLSWYLLTPLIIAASVVAALRPDWLLSWASSSALSPLTAQVRQFVVLAPFVVAAYLALWFGIRARARRVTDEREAVFVERLSAWVRRIEQPRWAATSLLALLAAWSLFMGGAVGVELAQNFSQKQIVQAYDRFAQGDAPLFKYRVDAKGASFYTRALPELTPAQFKERATGAERFFAIIPRAQLASINGEFRAAVKGATLPVLDASSFRFLLISNQLAEGEDDQNPIKRALVPELPKEKVRPAKFNFDDQIELVGWYIDPPNPKPGTRIEISLYWKALKKPTRNWKIFVHVDGSGSRIHGDHEPVEGLYPPTNWNPGDIVRDVYTTDVKSEKASGRYTVWAGLYSGDTRAAVKVGDKDNENRAKLGVLDVR